MISVVVPAFNEQESLEEFYKRLIPAISKLKEAYEVIFVDDGSTDSTLNILKKLSKENKNIKVFSFRRNQGKAEALTLGFRMSKGDYVVTLDADLQDRPEEIGKLLEKCKQGFDLVSGWRKNRKDSFKKVLSSKFFNFLMSLWGVKLHDYNCGLKVYAKEAAKNLNLYGGMHRFIPLLVYQAGFSVTEFPVEHDKRLYGKSKYGFSKLFKDVPDMFTMLFLSKYAKRPMHFFGMFGGVILTIGIIILIYMSVIHFMGERIGTRPLLQLGILFVLVGIQILFTGFLADLILHLAEKNSNDDKDKFALKYKTE